MKFNFFKYFLLVLFMICGVNAFAQDDVVSYETVVRSVVDLVTNYKGLGAIGIAGAVLSILIQILKTQVMSSLFKSDSSRLVKRLIVLSLGSVLSVLTLKLGGAGWLDSAIAGLITSGAAMAIYEAAKALKKS